MRLLKFKATALEFLIRLLQLCRALDDLLFQGCTNRLQFVIALLMLRKCLVEAAIGQIHQNGRCRKLYTLYCPCRKRRDQSHGRRQEAEVFRDHESKASNDTPPGKAYSGAPA